jgi:hypothetical protein
MRPVFGNVGTVIHGLLMGLLIGSPIALVALPASTTVRWDGGGCRRTIGTVEVTAISNVTGERQVQTLVGADLSQPLAVTFANLHQASWWVLPRVTYADGTPEELGYAQVVQGLGDPLPPDATPTPTPSPSPTPTPTPDPQTPVPTTPVPVPAGCTTAQTATDAAGNRWSILGQDPNGGHMWLVTPDGQADYAFPGGGWTIGSAAKHFIVVNGVAYGREIDPEFRKALDGTTIPGAGQYYRLIGRNQVARETPVCVAPEPTPTPTPTPTPSPTPTPPPPVPDPVLAAIAESTTALLIAIEALKPPVVVEPEVCKTTPLRVTVRTWPSSPIGSRTGSVDSGTFQLVEWGFTWLPSLRLRAKDTRGCSITVVK